MKTFLLATCLSFLISLAFANKKEGGEIKGRILDATKKPAFSCAIQLLRGLDSSLVKGEISDEEGRFSFLDIEQGDYLLVVSRLDLGKKSLPVFTLSSNQVLDLGEINIEETVKKLKEVEVIARKPMFQRIEDKMVFNIENQAFALGSNAYEMLRKAPGVVIDRDNRILLKGKTGVRIAINGKHSPLSVADLANFLKSIPASDLEAIEIIDNPSSKYDASGKAGIINIKLKKDKTLGRNGSANFSATQGEKYPKFESGARINNRNKKTNFYIGFTNNTFDNWSFNDFTRTQNGVRYEQVSETKDQAQGQFYRTTFDWFATPKHTFGAMYFGGYKETKAQVETKTRLFQQESGQWFESLVGKNEGRNFNFFHNANLNYEFKDSLGHKLTIDLDYDKYIKNVHSLQPNRYTLPNGEEIRNADFKIHMPSDIDIKAAKADYEQKLGGGKFSAGLKSTLIITDNTFDFFELPGGLPTKNLERSNQFVYTENVNAAYLNFSRKLGKKFNFQIGLRAEQTRSEGDLKAAVSQKDENVKREYLDFFPSATLNYELSEKMVWSLNYSRRIDRPSYQDLNPFENKLDELTYQKGNAFLKPQYTHSFSLENTLFQFLNQSVHYSYTSDFFGQITDTIEGSRAFITQKNIASEKVWSYNLSAPIPIAKWWNGYANFGINRLDYQADFGKGKKIDITVSAWNAYMQQTFDLKKGISLEISGFYNSPAVWGGTFQNREMWSLDVGLKMKFLEDRLTANLTIQDIFWTQKWRGTNNFGGLQLEARGGWESRQFRLAVIYRYGNQKAKGGRNRSSGSAAEQSRVKK